MTKLDFGNQHCAFDEELGNKFPEPLIKEVKMTTFAGSNHGYRKMASESATGLAPLLGSAPAN